MSDIWSSANVESALIWLRDTDEEFGQLKGKVLGMGKNEKVLFGAEYLDTEGSVDERKGAAYNSTAYREWLSEYQDAETDLAILTAKRHTKMAFIEAWRSVYSGRKKGNI